MMALLVGIHECAHDLKGERRIGVVVGVAHV